MDELDRLTRDLLSQFASSWNRADADTLASLFDQDATFINIAAGLMQGRVEIASGHAKGFATSLGGTRIAFGEINVRQIAPHTGLAIARWSVPGHHSRAGRDLPQRSGLLSVIVRIERGKGSIVAGHNTQTAETPPG